ncbi:MAG: HEAT repeat domain-containing protein [Isosphaeraceae bacterium]
MRDDPRSVNELISTALSDPDEDRVSAAISALQCRDSREVFDEAARLARSPCAEERRLAANLLAHLGWPGRIFPDECASILLGMLGTEQEPEVLRSALAALGGYRTPEVIEAACRFQRHPNHPPRDGVVSALLGCEDPRAIAALIALTHDEATYIRDYATFALTAKIDLDTPNIREALAARLEDPDADTQGEAMLALIRRGDPRVLTALLKSLESDEISQSEIEAALMIGDPRLHPKLVDLRGRWQEDSDLLAEAIEACSPTGIESRGSPKREAP